MAAIITKGINDDDLECPVPKLGGDVHFLQLKEGEEFYWTVRGYNGKNIKQDLYDYFTLKDPKQSFSSELKKLESLTQSTSLSSSLTESILRFEEPEVDEGASFFKLSHVKTNMIKSYNSLLKLVIPFGCKTLKPRWLKKCLMIKDDERIMWLKSVVIAPCNKEVMRMYEILEPEYSDVFLSCYGWNYNGRDCYEKLEEKIFRFWEEEFFGKDMGEEECKEGGRGNEFVVEEVGRRLETVKENYDKNLHVLLTSCLPPGVNRLLLLQPLLKSLEDLTHLRFIYDHYLSNAETYFCGGRKGGERRLLGLLGVRLWEKVEEWEGESEAERKAEELERELEREMEEPLDKKTSKKNSKKKRKKAQAQEEKRLKREAEEASEREKLEKELQAEQDRKRIQEEKKKKEEETRRLKAESEQKKWEETQRKEEEESSRKALELAKIASERQAADELERRKKEEEEEETAIELAKIASSRQAVSELERRKKEDKAIELAKIKSERQAVSERRRRKKEEKPIQIPKMIKNERPTSSSPPKKTDTPPSPTTSTLTTSSSTPQSSRNEMLLVRVAEIESYLVEKFNVCIFEQLKNKQDCAFIL
ncbi:hypothetical protein TrST_g8013 [Triparma strigata]|uniref:Uncharacterized protein n=1 Tax=Triparma strigata TaxID=1606541 RepID=A0A9W7B6M6_9STRA|nr:hypothetical protein TrST_g8013 [Triparma strigata]